MDSVFQRQIHLVTSKEPELVESIEEESSEENSDLENLGKELESLLEDKSQSLTLDTEDQKIVLELNKFTKQTTKVNSSYVPKRQKKTEEEERQYQRTMLEIQVKNDLKERGINPNSTEGKRILSEKIGSTTSLTHDTIWIKLTKREENADGTFKQGKKKKIN